RQKITDRAAPMTLKNLRSQLNRFDWTPISLIVIALPLIVPFLHSGITQTADAELHFHRIVSAIVNIHNGYCCTSWIHYLHLVFIYPLHNFHPPLIYIVGALTYLLLHLNIQVIFVATQVGITLLYPFGAYNFARTFTGKAGALVAACASTYAPYRFYELWV